MRPRWRAAFQPVDLADPDDPPASSLPGGGAGHPDHGRWRALLPRIVVMAIVAAVAIIAVVPVPRRIVETGTLIDAGTVVTVTVDAGDPPGTPRGHTGTYLGPVSRSARSALAAAVAVLDPARSLEPAAVERTTVGQDPVDTALLLGVGVAAGRAEAAALGLSATVDTDRVSPTSLAVLMEVVDQASSADLSAGRTVVALGSVGADGTLLCPEAADRSLAVLTTPPDVALVPESCGDVAVDVHTTLLLVPTLADAVAELANSR